MTEVNLDSGRVGNAPRTWMTVVLLFAFAVAVRIAVTAASGGGSGVFGYDDGVYMSATLGLLDGLAPYRDFVFLHPPGILAIGAGPTWVGQHLLGLSDASVFVLVRVLFIVLGGVNTVLVFFAGRHLSRVAGITAALLYAVWLPAIRQERTLLLEVIVVLGLVTALAVIPPVSNRNIDGRWRPVIAGLVGGVAVATKLWAALPLLVIFVGLLIVRRFRRAAAFAAVAVGSFTLLVAPFVAAKPSAFFDMVVGAQLGRPDMADSRLARIVDMGNFQAWPLSWPTAPLTFPLSPVPVADQLAEFTASPLAPVVVGGGLLILAVICVLAAWKVTVARTWVAVLVVQVAALMVSPVFFDGYPSFVAPALLLTLGAGAHLVWHSGLWRTHRTVRTASAAVFGVGVVALAWGAAMTQMGTPMRPEVSGIVASGRCVASDSPATLVLADRVTPNLKNSCMPVFDYTGVVYTMPFPKDGALDPSAVRMKSVEFQAFAGAYFGESDFVVLRRANGGGLTEATLDTITQRPVLLDGVPTVYGR